jgi:TRAP-type C4-dicarboxylate transport system substrate-binding protein
MTRLNHLMACWRRTATVLCGVLALSGVMAQAQAQTEPAPTQKLRIVGGLAGVNQYTRNEEPFWTQELSRLSAGKYDADIVPSDRAGVPGSDMLRLIQLGVMPFGTAILSTLSAQYPDFGAADLAGLNPDMNSLKKTVAAFRPYLEKTLRDRHGVEALALYVYPAQVVFCKKPLASLADLAGRRIRVSSATQSDFVSALGAMPVLTGFAQIMGSIASGNTECAITGSMSGNTLGLHEVTTHMHALPVTWGLAIFGANAAAWQALPPDLRALLSRELPKLEAAIWSESERETAEGLACNKGAPGCSSGRKGHMVEVAVSTQDERQRQEIFTSTVLTRWLQRCNARCTVVWNQTIGPVRGLMAPPAP